MASLSSGVLPVGSTSGAPCFLEAKQSLCHLLYHHHHLQYHLHHLVYHLCHLLQHLASLTSPASTVLPGASKETKAIGRQKMTGWNS